MRFLQLAGLGPSLHWREELCSEWAIHSRFWETIFLQGRIDLGCGPLLPRPKMPSVFVYLVNDLAALDATLG